MAKKAKEIKVKKVKKTTNKTMQICPDTTIGEETPCAKEEKKKATP